MAADIYHKHHGTTHKVGSSVQKINNIHIDFRITEYIIYLELIKTAFQGEGRNSHGPT